MEKKTVGRHVSAVLIHHLAATGQRGFHPNTLQAISNHMKSCPSCAGLYQAARRIGGDELSEVRARLLAAEIEFVEGDDCVNPKGRENDIEILSDYRVRVYRKRLARPLEVAEIQATPTTLAAKVRQAVTGKGLTFQVFGA